MRKWKTRQLKLLILMTILTVIPHLPSCYAAEGYNHSYQLLDHPNGSTYYKLNVTVQQSLYEFYKEKSHRFNSDNDFAKFVTPYALEPIAHCLLEIYTDDEDFVNGVLMIVHQIPYQATVSAKYPVETIVENNGDCDLLSYIAASIIMAGGLDVVLLYYETETHMNIGVSLSYVPNDARQQAYYTTYNQIRYYVAECTGGNWQTGWRVGECPDDLKQASAQIITLENCEQFAPGQVSATYKTLETSTLSLTVSPTYLTQGSTITLSGQLQPTLQDRIVTIYIKVNNSPWTVLDTVTTDSNGQFMYAWKAETAGMYNVRASWSGDNNYMGVDSPTRVMTVLSVFFVLLLVITVILACVGVVAFLASRQPQQEIQEPPTEISC